MCSHYRQFGDLCRRIKRTRTAFQMGLEFAPPFIDDGHRRDGRGVTQRAEGPAKHVLRQVLDVVDVLAQPAAVMETRERLLEPIRAFAAGNAPAAALMLVEL